MMNRIVNFHKILSISTDLQSKSKMYALKYFFTYMGVFFLSDILGYGAMTYVPIMLGLVMVRNIIKSENKILEILPVSKIYTIVNIYLFIIGALVLAGLIIMGILSIFGLITHIIPKLDFGGFETILSFIYGWKVVVVLFLIYLIIMSIFIPMFFVNKRITRWILYIIGYFVMFISLVIYKKTFLVTLDSNKINLIKTLNTMTNFNEILFDLLSIVAIALPLSLFISYRLYKGKGVKYG
ncbi:hypothetical protein SH2C18_27600 [Clostridium sediminicola]|uniref:hypothetical protein n=1 Tax=Clostridium sediminicola TaxID=3114879 RepID=UPI0031F1ECD8